MKYTIKDEKGKNLYRIYPYENGLCWCIDEYTLIKPRDKSKEPYWRWKFTETYPRTFELAVMKVQEWMIVKKKLDTSDLTELKKALTRNTNLIIKAIEGGK